jgi:histidinol phosphatase-like enzyme (inositol monophosphatase family)
MTRELLAFMHELADASAACILPLYRTRLAAADKSESGAFDPVTAADRAAEEAMRDLIRSRHPGHGVIGEEFGRDRPDAGHVWVLDPIDGTKSFISGMPIWGTLIALLRDGEPLLGMLNQPFLGERFWGDGETATALDRQGTRRLACRTEAGLGEALVWASSTFTASPAAQARLEAMRPQMRMLRYGSDCFAMAMLAEGHIDVVLETGLEIYDIAAHVPIIRGAGGVITALDGGAALHAADFLAAGSPALHRATLEQLVGAG